MKKLILTNQNFQKQHKAFTKRKELEGKSLSHIQSTTNLSKEFLHYLENRNVKKVKSIHQEIVDEYFDYLQRRKNDRKPGGLSTNYLEKHKEAVLRFIEFVKKVDIGQSGIYIPKFYKNKTPKDILTEKEIQILFSQTNNSFQGIRNRVILSLLYGCGLRKGELHQLNIEHIDMVKDVVRIEKTKTSKQRDVPMTKNIKQNLEEYIYSVREMLLPENSKESAFLLNNYGKRYSLQMIQLSVKKLAKQSGINKPISPHRLRHAIATHLLDELSLEEIALFLGHKNIDSTQIYTHIKYNGTNKQ